MIGDFAGRRAIVTGAASGIGAAIARSLLAAGATVVGVDLREPEPGDASDGRFVGTLADVSDPVAVGRLVAEVVDDGPVTDLFNVAGIGSTSSVPDTDLETWEHVFAVNARGTFLFCKHVVPAMATAGGGSIVNMASIAGLVGLRRRAAYCASKGAVIALTRALALDHVAEKIRVNCVCPGTVDSPWVRRLVSEAGEDLVTLRARQPMGRLGTPEEVAAAALFLASDAAAFATGTILTVDGGITAG